MEIICANCKDEIVKASKLTCKCHRLFSSRLPNSPQNKMSHIFCITKSHEMNQSFPNTQKDIRKKYLSFYATIIFFCITNNIYSTSPIHAYNGLLESFKNLAPQKLQAKSLKFEVYTHLLTIN